jgi:hypothetical protein
VTFPCLVRLGLKGVFPCVQPIARIPAERIRLVFSGNTPDDSQTPRDMRMNTISCIHVVQDNVNHDVTCPVGLSHPRDSHVLFPLFQVDLNGTITPEALHANCMYCHKAGAEFSIRPECSVCKCVSRCLFLTRLPLPASW